MQGFKVVQPRCNLSVSVKSRRFELESCPRIPLSFSNLTSKTRLDCAASLEPSGDGSS